MKSARGASTQCLHPPPPEIRWRSLQPRPHSPTMRVPKEIIVLLVLLAGVMAFVLWYVADRKAKMRAEQNAPRSTTTAPAAIPDATTSPNTDSIAHAPLPEPVVLGGANEQKTIDFSSGKGVVKDTPEDRAAMATALEDMAAAQDSMTFGPRKKPAATATPAPTTSESTIPAVPTTPPKS